MTAGSVLVTGATGFLGRALVTRLTREGARAVCLVRAASPNLPRLPSGTSVEAVVIDPARGLRGAIAGRRFDAVFHLATYGVHAGERDAEALRAANTTLTRELVEALDPPAGRVVFTGTCMEYAPAKEPERIAEDHPLAPTSVYGEAKAEAEQAGREAARARGIPFVPLRLFNVFGPGEAPERLIPHLAACLTAGDTPSLTPGDQARDFTYVDDVIDAVVRAASAPAILPDTPYNVCTGVPTRIREIAALVAARLGRSSADLGLGRRPYRPDEAMWIVGDGGRFHEATGWAPKVSVEEGVARMVAATSRGVKP